MLSLISHLEHNEGAFYPKGGMISITNALYRLALKLGVQFSFGKVVQQITTTVNRVNGVVVDQQQHDASIIVSNMDVYFTYKHLLDQPKKAAKIKKQERSSSALIFYWGINKIFPQLDVHNIFLAKIIKESSTLFLIQACLLKIPLYILILRTRLSQAFMHPQEKKIGLSW